MTARELYDAVLIELNKENAPNILLEQFNYLANKSVNQYINKRYNIYDISQQTTDDLRVLKATAILNVNKTNMYNDLSLASDATYEAILPSDYLHILNCICIYDVKKTYKCYNSGDTWRCAAIRLTSDAYSQVLDNFWSKPSYKKPYYYIHNVNSSNEIPTNPYNSETKTGTDRSNFNTVTEILEEDRSGNIIISDTDKDMFSSIDISGIGKVSNVLKTSQVRYGNASQVRLEIRYGTDDSIFELKKVYVDYIKAPLHIRLTQALIDYTEDKSQVLEFPDYVCQEIINELVHIVMENISDLRLTTHPVVSLSIANPAQTLTPEAAG